MKHSHTRKRAEEAITRCRKLASYSEDQGSTRRTFLSPPVRDCHREITGWMEALNMPVRVDAAGNLRGVYPGIEVNAPRLLLGSHLDTVPNAGAYDGILGVVIAVSLLEALEGRRLPFAIEVVGFSEEEGVRFGVPFIGSRALVGRVGDELLQLRDREGVTLRKAIELFGLNPADIPRAKIAGDCLGYIEFHIEQGPVLEELGKSLAAVDSIAGQSRLEFTFLGRSNHAGTTPMHFRHDALAAAAEWIVAVERTARDITGLVASVGKIKARPGASNVIAGEARLTLDVRHASDETRSNAVKNLIEQAKQIAQRRGLKLEWEPRLDQRAVPMDPFLLAEIERAIAAAGCAPHRMMSGAGHDAMIMAEKIPSAMIFLRTPGGISHDPAESVSVEDVEKAIECGLHLLHQLAASPAASSPAIQERIGSA
jgi:allantoate deiminase